MPLTRSLLKRLTATADGRRSRKLSTGIVIALCAGLLLPALVGGLALTTLRQQQMLAEAQLRLDDKIQLLASSLADPVWNLDEKSIQTIARSALLDPQVARVAIRDQEFGLILAVERPERRVGDRKMATRALILDSKLVGEVELEVGNSISQREFLKDRRAYYLILVGQFVFALMLILFALRKSILRPLAHLSAFSNQLASGELDRPIQWQRTDEIGRLAAQMDQMRGNLRAILGEQRIILDNVPVGVIFARGRMIEAVNRHAERIFGFAAGTMHGLTSRVIYLSDEQFKAVGERAYTAIAAPGAHYEEELMLRRRDGQSFWARLHGSAIDAAAPMDGSIWVFEDISERRRAAAQLRLSATVFENTADGVVITDREQQIVAVNRSFELITGYSEKEAVGQRITMLSSGRQGPEFYVRLWLNLNQYHRWHGEIWNRRKNGEIYPEELTITAVFNAAGELEHYVGVFNDITFRKAAEEEIRYLAFYDPLTRLPNRRLMLDRLEQTLTSNRRNQRAGALMMIDLDNFKTLNDTLGHDVGDQLLINVAARLQTCVRQVDTVARMGGDEFVVILEDLDRSGLSAMHAESVARKILIHLAEPFDLDVMVGGVAVQQHAHQCTSSIGITVFRDEPITTDELMKRADTAMYEAKAAGRNTLRFFDPDMQVAITQRASIEAELRQALEADQFLLHYQPQVDAAGCVIGCEALLRWQHPVRGTVPPAQFIPVAEDTGLILPIGNWVLEQTCGLLAVWATQPALAGLTIAVNVSARQFHQDAFVTQVLAALDRSGANPQRLKLELTESLLIDDVDSLIGKMSTLKARGVGFSLDDFGTGYSSLAYLKRLPIDQLKIDQSFVRDVLTDSNDASIARTIVALGQSLGLSVIAEGVETEAQRDFLVRHECFAYQGYLFSRPLPLADFEAFAMRDVIS